MYVCMYVSHHYGYVIKFRIFVTTVIIYHLNDMTSDLWIRRHLQAGGPLASSAEAKLASIMWASCLLLIASWASFWATVV